MPRRLFLGGVPKSGKQHFCWTVIIILSCFLSFIYRFLSFFLSFIYRFLSFLNHFHGISGTNFIIILSFFIVFLSFGKAAWIREIIFYHFFIIWESGLDSGDHFFTIFLIIWECGLDSGDDFCIIWDSSPASGDHGFITRQSALDSGAHTRIISCNAGRDFMRKDICPFVCHATCGWLSAR